MQWGQIKTIFIICFLVLDIYLLTQVLGNERNQGDMFYPETASLEEELKEKQINTENVPTSTENAPYISTSLHNFTDEEIETLVNQNVVSSGKMIYSELKSPVLLGDNAPIEAIVQNITTNVLNGDQYTFYEWNQEDNILLFFQKVDKRPLYFNSGGVLTVYLNEKFEITSYAQTFQEDIEQQGEAKEVSKPQDIVEVLLRNNKLYNGDKISSMELGYHTFFPLENNLQVFVPTWKVTINGEADKRVQFVNAMDGQIIEIDDIKFYADIEKEVEQLRAKIGSEES